MTKLRFNIAISLDGYVAGPEQSEENPIGVGGMRLHDWLFQLAVFNEIHGRGGGEINASTTVVKGWFENVGATIMGRNIEVNSPRLQPRVRHGSCTGSCSGRIGCRLW